ncbi:hypothetical protein [Synechocystis sp. CACIAM 05]|uniref:hypothetical protein n=1 Tax=Synechocystis sp. CACIAM 05 TaxID=1933929 RepID=UPI00138E93E4|nr:hypothetical protein [Synechocystis sp. CACIAM 05]QHV00980.1 hypothetical protein BWK47_13105 [Synechocystis sp. CACIAM 05]
MKNLSNLQRYVFILPILIITVSWIYLFISSGIFKVGFNYFLDDHSILLAHSKSLSFHDIFFTPFATLVSPEQKLRFRPLYDVFIGFLAKVYGLRPLVWYLSSCIIAITTSLLFYLIGRLQNFSYLESILFTGLIVLGPQASTYARFGTPETTSTFLIALAFFVASLKVNQKHLQLFLNSLFLLFSIAASLNKEACILMLPALAFFKVWYISWKEHKSFKKAFLQKKITVLFMIAIFLLLLAYIKLTNVGGPGYAGIDNNTFYITSYINLFQANKSAFGLALITNFMCGIIYFQKICHSKFKLNANVLKFYVFCGLIIIPQMILYSKSGLTTHYLLPASIGISWLTIYPLNTITKKRNLYSKVIAFILTIIIVIAIGNNFMWTKQYFIYTTKRIGDIEEMIQDVSSCTGNNSSLVIFANPYTNYEMIFAFKVISDKIFNNNQVFLATYGTQNSHFITNTINEKGWHFLNPEALENIYNNQAITSLTKENLEEIKGIVLANAREFERDFTQLKIDGLKLDLFTSKYYENLNIRFYCRL